MRAMAIESTQGSLDISRGIALYSLAFHTLRRGLIYLLRWDPSCWIVINFEFGKTLRKSKDARVVLADPERAETCAYRGVFAHLDAARSHGWDLSLGHLFPEVESDTRRADARRGNKLPRA